MSAPAALKGMVAVSEGTELQPLGFVTWFSVPDRPISLNQLKLRWLVAGLDPTVLPKDPRALYLFKRAMRAQEGVKGTNGSTVETVVHDVKEDADYCTYQITRVVKDEDQELVEYPKACKVTYMKRDDEVRYAPLEGATRDEIEPMRKGIEDYLADNAKMIDGRKVRTLVRKFLKDSSDPRDVDEHGRMRVTGLGGENLRGKGGGVYFVKFEHKSDLKALATALEGLYPDGAAFLRMIPLADGAEERDLIRKSHIINAKAEIDEAIADVAELLREDRKNAVRSDVKDYWLTKMRLLQERSAEYEHLLKEEQGDVKDALRMAALQIERLVA